MARRIPISARVLPGLRHSFRQFRVDLAGTLSASRGGRPIALAALNERPSSASLARAQSIMEGEYRQFGLALVCAADEVWTTPLPSLRFAKWLHGFEWISDLAVYPDREAAQKRVSDLVTGWLAQYGGYNRFVWQPELVSTRLASWISDGAALLSLDQSEAEPVLKSIQRQSHYLRRTYRSLPKGVAQIDARITLARLAARQGRSASSQLSETLTALDGLLSEQVLPDGGHISRSPETTLRLLTRLKSLDHLLDTQGLASSPGLARAIDRMAPMIAFFSHTDGGLASFQGGGEGDYGQVSDVTSVLTTKPFAFAPHSRYQRLDRQGTIILMDVGGPAPFPHDGHAHLGPMAFEMSVPEGRLVTNCGWSQGQPPAWRIPVKRTAAHSTLDVVGRDAGRLLESDDIAPPYDGKAVYRDCMPVTVERREAELGIIVDASHQGFVPSSGHIHARRLFLAENGHDLRGEDSLRPARDGMDVFTSQETVCLRFHLHPDVEPTLGSDGRHVRLTFPDGRDWLFLSGAKVDDFTLEVDESAFLGSGARPVQTRQIVIRGPVPAKAELTIPWAFKRADVVSQKAHTHA